MSASSAPIVTPDIESAASSLLEMSSNAAARAKQSSNAAVFKAEFDNAAARAKQSSNAAVFKAEFDNSAGRAPLSRTSALIQSISAPVVTSPKSAPLSYTTVTGSRKTDFSSTVTRPSNSNSSSVQVGAASHETSMSQSITNETGSSVNTCNVGQIGPVNQPKVNMQGKSPVCNYSSSVNEHVYPAQTLQTFCHPVYQGMGVCHSPLPPPYQGQQFSFVQPLLQQTVNNVPYQLQQFPYVPYQTSCPAPITSQLTAWSYLPNVEPQFPMNLSTHGRPRSASVPSEGRTHYLSGNNPHTRNNWTDGQQLQQDEPHRTGFTIQTELSFKTNTTISETSNESNPKRPRIGARSLSVTEGCKTSQGIVSTIPGRTQYSRPAITSSVPLTQISKTNLQALSDLTMGIGVDAGRKETNRIYLGADMQNKKLEKQTFSYTIPKSELLEVFGSEDNNKVVHSYTGESGRQSKNCSISSETDKYIPGGAIIEQIGAKSGETVYLDPDRKRLSLTAFPYSQEIKLPDGQMSLIKLKGDCISLANIKAKRGDGMGIPNVNIDPNTLTENYNYVELLNKGQAKTVDDLIQLQNENENSLQQTRLARTVKENDKENHISYEVRETHNMLETMQKGKLKNGIGQDLKQEPLNQNETCGVFQTRPLQPEQPGRISSVNLKEKPSNITIQISKNALNSGDAMNTVNPVALRMAKTPWGFGHSEYNRVKTSMAEMTKPRSRSDSSHSECNRVKTSMAEMTKPRSRSDSSLSSIELTQPYKYPIGKRTGISRKRVCKSEGDGSIKLDQARENNHPENLDNGNSCTNDLVHVVDKDQVVTVKVAKYPELTITPGNIVGKYKHASQVGDQSHSSKRRINTSQQNVFVGKVPVLRSVAKEPSYLSVAERQYLDQIQQYPQIKYHNSSLAQLLMNDIKDVNKGKAEKETASQPKTERSSGSAIVKISPEQLLSDNKVLQVPAKKIKLTDSNHLGQNLKVKLNETVSLINDKSPINDKSTSTNQEEDDDVFLDDVTNKTPLMDESSMIAKF